LYGMWMATATLLPLGAFLTYKATTDSVLLDSSFYTTLTNKITTPLNRLFRLIQPKKD
jgi:lipopolysaccharide export system permease protein